MRVHAQFRGGIQGTVTDKSGAVVVGAKLALTNEETGVTQENTTGSEGFYRFSSLPPGPYTISAEFAGFRKAIREHVIVRAEQLEGLNLTLTPGAVTETLTVSEAYIPRLQTENANLDATITPEQITRLPQFGRDPYELIRQAPGVFGLGARSATGGSEALPNSSGPGGSNSSVYQTENQVPITANGQRLSGNSFTIDGVSVDSQAWGGAATITPNMESVKEMRVVANSYSAENGRTSGALIQVVSKSGTNQLHGSFRGSFARPELNAFARWGGPTGSPPSKVLKSYNQWGGSLGGPAIKNRAFLFFSFDRLYTDTPSQSDLWSETPELTNLIKAQRPDSIAAKTLSFPGFARNYTVIPQTCAQLGFTATNCREVPGGLDIGSLTGAVGVNVTNPLGGGLDGIPDIVFGRVTLPAFDHGMQYNGRADFHVTQSDVVTFSTYYTIHDVDSFNSTSRPGLPWHSDRLMYAGALLWTRTLSPVTVNEARANVNRWYFDELKQNPQMPWWIPRQQISATNPYPALNFGPANGGVFYQTSYNFRDILSRVVKRHVLKVGVEITREQNNDINAGALRPTYNFSNIWSFANDVASSETGNFDPKTGFPSDVRKYVRTGYYAWFVEDDWKIRPNLTMNLGLRWEYFTPLSEKYGSLSNGVLGSGVNPLPGIKMILGNSPYRTDHNSFGPQVGLAWSPRRIFGHDLQNKAVVRGGFGVGYNRIPESVTLNGRSNPPLPTSFSFTTGSQILYTLGTNQTNGAASAYSFPSNPNAVLTFDPNTNLPLTGTSPNVFIIPKHLVTPYSYRYSLEIQYDLGRGWISSLGYQGSASHKFMRTTNYQLWYYPTNTALRTVTVVLEDVNANYNAMIARLTHQFSHGLSLNAQYRWSKSIDTCSNDNNCVQSYPFDQSTERGPSDFDVKHYFVASGVWDLPTVSARKGWINKTLAGWEISGILTATTGFPWTPVYNGSDCATTLAAGGLCPLRPIAYLGGAGTDTSNDTFMKLGGNFPGSPYSYFVRPPTGTALAVPPRPGIGRNAFRGPQFFQVDMVAGKRIGLPKMRLLGENAALDLRANFFNIFNKLNLAPFGFNSASTQINNVRFGQATAVRAGRVVEFQFRFSF